MYLWLSYFSFKKYFMNHFLISDPQKLSNTDLLWDLTIAVLITSSFGAVLFLLCLFKYYLSNCLIERRDQDSPYSLLKQNNRAKPQSYGSSWHIVLYKDSIIRKIYHHVFHVFHFINNKLYRATAPCVNIVFEAQVP